MPLPTTIREMLAPEHAYHPDLAPGMPLDGACMGAKHHSPRPLLLHEVDLPNGEHAMLCGTCKDNLATLVYLLRLHRDGMMPWTARREFGNQIRALAGC